MQNLTNGALRCFGLGNLERLRFADLTVQAVRVSLRCMASWRVIITLDSGDILARMVGTNQPGVQFRFAVARIPSVWASFRPQDSDFRERWQQSIRTISALPLQSNPPFEVDKRSHELPSGVPLLSLYQLGRHLSMQSFFPESIWLSVCTSANCSEFLA